MHHNLEEFLELDKLEEPLELDKIEEHMEHCILGEL